MDLKDFCLILEGDHGTKSEEIIQKSGEELKEEDDKENETNEEETTVENSVEPEDLVHKTEDLEMVIGRKIKLIGAEGNVYSVAKSKGYFEKYEPEKLGFYGRLVSRMKKNKNDIETLENEEELDIYKDLEKEMKETKMPKVNNLDPIIAYGLKEGLANKILTTKEVVQIIKAIESKNKDELNKVLPIKWDRSDLSKGAFLPWNKKSRDQIVKKSEENKELTEITGEYEPNPLKRLMRKARKYLPARKKQKYITDGSEKTISSRQKLRDFQVKAGIKLGQDQLQEYEQEIEGKAQEIEEQETDKKEIDEPEDITLE